ncbi:aspartyl protease family protein [Arcticibacterium luteifluviistationis]|uniref:Signal protein PDZ n=1 Tax=Arcticibacterium luteifluviistationis TaxID=1784714 RepID=A0A2Z4G8P8_9BACT|nr:aspartyl protease family protein [Arcticibacterium luteifluviistationis]AWV97363.1 signal protein PDZ [Arcticibacterium luteifluviistationis]
MKKLSSITALMLTSILMVFSMNTMAQFWKKKSKKVENYGFHINGGKKFYSIPFKVYSNLIVVPVVLDDSDTLNFILDTGVSSIFITEPSVAEKLGLEYVREVAIYGAGEGESLLAKVSIDHEFKLGKITGYRQNVVVLSEDILHLSEFMGVPIHGIFGHSLFENFVVTIDFSNFVMTVRQVDGFKFRRRYGDKYPIVVTESKPYTDAIRITEGGNPERTVRMVIDTGAGHALLLNSEEGHIQLPEKVIRANLGRGLNGEIFGNIGRIPKVSIGKYELNNVIASFPDSLAFSMKFPPTDDNRQGSIGGEFLRRFKVTLNYSEGYMALKPIRKRINQPFDHDMSGLDIRAQKDNLSRLYVVDVIDGSPGYVAGLRAKDEIVFINNDHVDKLTLAGIYRLLSRKEGKLIEIFYRRDGVLTFTTFKLKRAI